MLRFEEGAFDRLCIPGGTQEKPQGIAFRIDGLVEVHPIFSEYDVGLVNFPRVVARFRVRPRVLFQFRDIVLNPGVDGGINDPESALDHHLFEITVAE